ncbi:MAG: hypothetical protein K8R53_01145 [Bacteroidales bacterium]|nr:hypothetical protein [Bacteroidales bacterium]
MKTFRIKLKLRGSYLTPWQADTIFGNLCWIVLRQEGISSLTEFLDLYRGVNANPPFIISNAYPLDLLPKPLNAINVYLKFNSPNMSDLKELKKIKYVNLDTFNKIRNSKDFKFTNSKVSLKKFTTVHTAINRLSNTALEGALFELHEYLPVIEDDVKPKEVEYLSIYLMIKTDWEEKVNELFQQLSLIGYGKRKSIGKGAFKVISLDEFDGFTDIEDANGFVSLSNFVPAENDPTEGLYHTFIKYGKMGEEFALGGNPFKKPLLMFEAGSVFKSSEPPKNFYGKMIDNISYSKDDVKHYAFSFPISVKYAD